MGPISVAIPDEGLIWYRLPEITTVIAVNGAVEAYGKFSVMASKVAYSFPPAPNRLSKEILVDPSRLVEPGIAGTAGMPVDPISVAAPVSGFTV